MAPQPQDNPYAAAPDGFQYPPQPPTGAVNAPGGYPAAAAGAPPGSYPPSGATPPSQYPYYGNDDFAKQQQQSGAPAGYPGAASGYPGTSPATGYPVTGTPMGQSAVAPENEPCRCTVGWVLFALGWIFPICWIIACFLPCCSRSLNDRRASMASATALLVYSIVIIVLATTRNSWYYNNRGYYNYYG